MEITLSLGYDVERPYGKFAELPEGKQLRKRQISFVRKLNKMLDMEKVPRTFFILGHYLKKCLDDFDEEALREIYNKNNPLIEIQQHSYSHPIFKEVKWWEDKQVITSKEFIDDLLEANRILNEILGVQPNGLRVPLGYCCDLSDMPEILQGLYKMKFNYVSSNLKSEELLLKAHLTSDRQPHSYGEAGYHDIIEIPSHGWHDVIFTMEHSQKFFNREPDKPEKILEHYEDLLEKAKKMLTQVPSVNIALIFHPWAMMEYDPELEIHKKIIDSARQKGFNIKTYGTVADDCRL